MTICKREGGLSPVTTRVTVGKPPFSSIDPGLMSPFPSPPLSSTSLRGMAPLLRLLAKAGVSGTALFPGYAGVVAGLHEDTAARLPRPADPSSLISAPGQGD